MLDIKDVGFKSLKYVEKIAKGKLAFENIVDYLLEKDLEIFTTGTVGSEPTGKDFENGTVYSFSLVFDNPETVQEIEKINLVFRHERFNDWTLSPLVNSKFGNMWVKMKLKDGKFIGTDLTVEEFLKINEDTPCRITGAVGAWMDPTKKKYGLFFKVIKADFL